MKKHTYTIFVAGFMTLISCSGAIKTASFQDALGSKIIPPGKACVYIYRPAKFTGAAIDLNVYDVTKSVADGKTNVSGDGDNYDIDLNSVFAYGVLLGTLKTKEFIAVECEPGERIIVARMRARPLLGEQNKNLVKLNLEADKKYYVHIEFGWGGRALIQTVGETDALKDISNCHVTDRKIPVE
jgi:Protein of unknown function (DUF2846).